MLSSVFDIYIFLLELTYMFGKPTSTLLFEIVLASVKTYPSTNEVKWKNVIILFLDKRVFLVNEISCQ